MMKLLNFLISMVLTAGGVQTHAGNGWDPNGAQTDVGNGWDPDG